MISFAQFAWSILPGLLWLAWVYRRDIHEPEPLKLVLKVYVAGMLITVPAGLTNSLGIAIFPLEGAGAGSTAIAAFLIVGPGEELWKLLVMWTVAFHRSDFNEPMDGLVYSGAAALGFASMENVGYLMDYGSDVIQIRAITAVPAHFLFAAFWGYAAGIGKGRADLLRIVFAGWLLAAMVHGAYDFGLVAGAEAEAGLLTLGAFALMIGTALIYSRMVRRLQAISPFHPAAGGLRCDPCGVAFPSDSAFCHDCGRPLTISG